MITSTVISHVQKIFVRRRVLKIRVYVGDCSSLLGLTKLRHEIREISLRRAFDVFLNGGLVLRFILPFHSDQVHLIPMQSHQS